MTYCSSLLLERWGGLRFKGLVLLGDGLGENERPGLVLGHLLKYFPRAILVCG